MAVEEIALQTFSPTPAVHQRGHAGRNHAHSPAKPETHTTRKPKPKKPHTPNLNLLLL